MRQLHPTDDPDIDPLELYPADPRPAPADRPWVMVNMVASADGATSVDGVSADLGGAGDRLVFRAIRASCDWIVAAAGTVRAEHYRIPRPAPEVADRRIATGRTPAARLAVVSTSANLDPELPLFADRRTGGQRPLVITGAAPTHGFVAAIGDRAEWAHLPAERPSVGEVIDELGRRGARVVLAEGGPSFSGQLADAGLIDEFCVTVSPHLIGGTTPRVVHDARQAVPAQLRLDRLLEHDGALFARYLRA